MSKQRTRLVEESDTIYEIDENCMKKRKKYQKPAAVQKKRRLSTADSAKNTVKILL